MEISWTDHAKNGLLQRDKEEINFLHTVKGRKVNWIGHMLSTTAV